MSADWKSADWGAIGHAVEEALVSDGGLEQFFDGAENLMPIIDLAVNQETGLLDILIKIRTDGELDADIDDVGDYVMDNGLSEAMAAVDGYDGELMGDYDVQILPMED